MLRFQSLVSIGNKDHTQSFREQGIVSWSNQGHGKALLLRFLLCWRALIALPEGPLLLWMKP